MHPTNMTKKQLLTELTKLHSQLDRVTAPSVGDNSASIFSEEIDTHKSILNKINVGVYRITLGHKSKFLYANPAIASIFGYDSVENFTDKKGSELFKNISGRQHFFNELIQNGIAVNKELKVTKKDGTPITIIYTAKVEYDKSGKINWIDGIVEDITERKKVETKFIESEKKWRMLVQNLPEYILKLDQDGTIHEVNKPIAGLKPEEMMGVSILEMVSKKHHKIFKAAIDEAVLTKNTKILEISRICPEEADDSWYEICIVPIEQKEQGDVEIACILTDISERKKAIDALFERELQFSEITENMTDMVAICDMKGIYKYVSPSHKTSLGYDPDYLLGKMFLDFIHEDDIKSISSELKKGLKNRPIGTNEYRIKCSDGNFKWIEATGKILFNRNGKAEEAIINARDISLRKMVEEDLVRMGQALESSSEAISMADPDGNHIYQNRAFTNLFGFTEANEFQKIGYQEIYADKTIAYEIFSTARAGKSWMGEIEMKSKSGRFFPVHLRVDAVKDFAGNIIGFVGLHTDISQRKEVEKKLIDTIDEVRNLSLRDDLTGLYNRRGFLTLAEQQLKIADRMMDDILLLFADMDYLKLINDTYGHKTGDMAIINAAECLKETFRESDIIARIGGDEFVVLTIETTEANAETLIQRLETIIDTCNENKGNPYKISLSIGSAKYNSSNPCTVEELISRADKIMYDQKRIKQNLVKIYQPSMNL